MKTSPCSLYFIDANIPMYAAGREHPLKAPSLRILESIALGRIRAVTDAEVLQEILHRYTALHRVEFGIEVCKSFLQIVPMVLPVTVVHVHHAMSVLRQEPSVQARDALHVAVMRYYGISCIITADRHFDLFKDIVRVDPTEMV